MHIVYNQDVIMHDHGSRLSHVSRIYLIKYLPKIQLYWELMKSISRILKETLASTLNPSENHVSTNKSAVINGKTQTIMSAKAQLAIKAIIRPDNTVAMFWTSSANASPTRHRTVDASLDNLAQTAPLH